MQDVIQIQK